MKRLTKKILPLAMAVLAAINCCVFAAADEAAPAAIMVDAGIPAKSAILIEQQSGRVLYEKDADQKLPPASITKIMTLLLVMEALDSGKLSLDDTVTCSPHASSMGGSQIWFEPGEQMTVHDTSEIVFLSSASE